MILMMILDRKGEKHMEDNYNKAYKEVVEILKHVPKESVEKIPKDMREMFEAEQDNAYDFKIDESKEFEEQELLEETKAILANIFRDYWATPYQRERILAKEQQDRQMAEEQKIANYNPNDIFKKKEIPKPEPQVEENYNTNLPVKVKEERFYHKLINFIKNLFRIGGK